MISIPTDSRVTFFIGSTRREQMITSDMLAKDEEFLKNNEGKQVSCFITIKALIWK